VIQELGSFDPESLKLLWHWATLLGAATLIFIGSWFALNFLKGRLMRWSTAQGNRGGWPLAAGLLASVRTSFLGVLALALALEVVFADSKQLRIFEKIFILVIWLQGALLANKALGESLRIAFERNSRQEKATNETSFQMLQFLLRGVLWITLVLIVLDNLGVQVTALITGLGIGGVAVALALQNILGDLFASLTIAFDKPFQVGDNIEFGVVSGSVEKVGLKTTKLRSASGEQVIVSNTDLLKSVIRNFKRMDERRVAFVVGLTYESDFDFVKTFPNVLKDLCKAQPLARFERAHLKNLGASAYEFEVVYWVQSSQMVDWMDIQQQLNLAIAQFVRDSKGRADFAYPTQTVHLAKAEAPSKMF
jgi:small-conductance mechanosensitive channel